MVKFLPAGVQNFEKMMLGNFVYVDKTRYVYEMARALQGFYFLARPRRFGKSLLASTFEYLFKGRRELFEKSWIAQSDWPWKPHPVVTVDFSSISYESPQKLETDLTLLIEKLAKEQGVEPGRGS